MVASVSILDKVPENIDQFEQLPHYAIDAYSCDTNGNPGPGDFSQEAKEMAIRTAGAHYGLIPQEVTAQFEIIIVPGIGFHGRIFAKRK